MEYVVESLKRHPHYKNADWDLVWHHIPILSRQVYHERKRNGLAHNRDTITLLKGIDKIARDRFVQEDSCHGGAAWGSGKPAVACDPDSDPSDTSGPASSSDGGEASEALAAGQGVSFRVDIATGAAGASGRSLGGEVPREQQLHEARLRFLSLVKASYRSQFQEGANRSWPAMQVLLEASSRAQDHTDRPLDEWQSSIRGYCEGAGGLPLCGWAPKPSAALEKLPLPAWAGRAGRRAGFRRMADCYNVASTFVRAHKSVVSQFRHFIQVRHKSPSLRCCHRCVAAIVALLPSLCVWVVACVRPGVGGV